MEDMGIENKDEIVIYDNSDVISSCRCWYNLIYFGHDPKLVHVLDGGFKKWNKENKTTNNKEVITKISIYSCKENTELVKNKKHENINKNNPHNHSYELIKGDSKDKNICDKINKKIDFLFIDGDHSKEGVTKDFLNLKDKVNKGGLILFDNYSDPAWIEVKPAVDELCNKYSNEYIIKLIVGHCLVLKKL